MNTFSIVHPSGEQYELDWYNNHSAPTNRQLGDILTAHTGRSPLSPTDTGSPFTQPASPMLQTAVETGNPPSNFQLASATHTNSGLTPYAQSILDRYDNAEVESQDKMLPQELKNFRPTLVAMLQKYGANIQKAPANVRATLYAITQLGDTAYGLNGTVTDPDLENVPSGSWKCNIFASKTYARGAGIGYNVDGKTNGYPTYGHPRSGQANVPVADAIYSPRFNMSNFTHTTTPHVGDLFAFYGNNGEPGHSGLYLGGNLAIYAGTDGVKVGTLPYIKQEDQYQVNPKFRTYTPGH